MIFLKIELDSYNADLGPTHTSLTSSHCHPKARISNDGNPFFSTIKRGQPSAMRSIVSGQLRTPLMASAASTLQAPTAQAAERVASGVMPRSKPSRKPAIVASPEPVVPTTDVAKQGAHSSRLVHALSFVGCPRPMSASAAA